MPISRIPQPAKSRTAIDTNFEIPAGAVYHQLFLMISSSLGCANKPVMAEVLDSVTSQSRQSGRAKDVGNEIVEFSASEQKDNEQHHVLVSAGGVCAPDTARIRSPAQR
jgi:hypothetical protein